MKTQDNQNNNHTTDPRMVKVAVRINPETIIWEISYDGGNTWESTGTYAKGKDGEDGSVGPKGTDGINGKDGDVVIKSVKFLTLEGVDIARFELASGYFDVPIIK